MKNTKILTLATICSLVGVGNAMATPHTYANAMSAHNIAVIQHSIMNTAFNSVSGISSAVAGGTPLALAAQKVAPAPASAEKDLKRTDKNYTNNYGKPKIYGEYNDDGNAGRNGGDTAFSRANLTNIWSNWNHYGDDVAFKGNDRMDTDYDIAMLGISGGATQWDGGESYWGIYAGFVGSDMSSDTMEIRGNGGYFGIYNGYNFGKLSLAAALSAGAISNNVDIAMGDDEFTNMWAGGAVVVKQNIILDDTFTLQPEIYTGYTWVKSANYISTSGAMIENQDFNVFEIAPGIRAIKHIGNGWYGGIGVKYVFNFVNDGDVTVNDMVMDNLETRDYSEYGLTLEKSIDNFSISANLSRRDGGRIGWLGGVNLKYTF